MRKWLKIGKGWTLFLDRNGTINKRRHEYIKNWEAFSFVDSVPEAISELNLYFNYIFIVSNQEGIGLGEMSHQEIDLLHEKMVEVLQYFGAHIDQIYYSVDDFSVESSQRKPNPGMALAAQSDFPNVEFSKSIMVGDKYSDIIFGKNLGMKTVWIENDWENGDRGIIEPNCDLIIHSLKELIHYIVFDPDF